MKRILQIAVTVLAAHSAYSQTAQFTVKMITPDTMKVYFKPDVNINNVVTGISNLTFVLQVPQTFSNPHGNWVVIPNAAYLGSVSTNTATSSSNGSMYNTLFSWTSNPNINGTNFISATEYLLATIVPPTGITASNVTIIDWGNNRIDNGAVGAPIWATSLAIDGIDRTNETTLFYGNTSTGTPSNSGTPTLSSSLALTGTPLSIRNLVFDGQLNGSIADLKWTVESEHNMARYEVEYSKDGEAWAKINSVTALNKSNAKYGVQYTIDGKSINNFFRLKIIDLAGVSTYSKIINLIAGNKQGDIALLPNAVKAGESMMLVHDAGISDGEIKIVDVTGKVVKQFKGIPDNIVTTGMSAGQYYLYMTAPSKQAVLKFTVL